MRHTGKNLVLRHSADFHIISNSTYMYIILTGFHKVTKDHVYIKWDEIKKKLKFLKDENFEAEVVIQIFLIRSEL